MDEDLPQHINYWLTTSSKHDCFFNVGPNSGLTERIGAISIFLTGHSEVLRKMFEGPLAEKGDVTVTDSDPETFRNFLKCVYGGAEIVIRKLSYEKCLNVLYLCEKYLTSDIKEKISSIILQLYQPLSIDNVLMGLSNAACLQSKSLEEAISRAVQNGTDKIINHKSFLGLDSNDVLFVVKQNKISTTEINLWNAVLNWAQKKIGSDDSKDLRLTLGNILKHIRFCTMESYDFCKFVVPSNVLTPEEVFEVCKSIGTTKTPNLDGLCCETLNRSKSLTQEITFTHIINNISEFSGTLSSPKFKLGEFNWNMKLIKKTIIEDDVGIFLECSSVSNKQSWTCSASGRFEIVRHCGKPNMSRNLNVNKYSNKSDDWGYREFTTLENLVDPKEGFLKNNCIEFIVHVKLQSE